VRSADGNRRNFNFITTTPGGAVASGIFNSNHHWYDTFTGRVLSLPKRKDVNLPINEQLIVELYSK